MMVNTVPLESYLRGVVPHEVPPSWPIEALKAQACAARAFVLGSRKPTQSWDVYCDVRSQAYVGIGIEDPSTDRAGPRDGRGRAGLQRQAHPGGVLLLLRRAHREHPVRVAGSVVDPLPQGRRRPLRHLRHPARLGTAAPHGRRAREAARRGRHAARRVHGQARHLAAHRQGRPRQQRRRQVHGRQRAAHEARPQEHLGRVHEHVHRAGGARPRHGRRRTASLTLKGRIYPALGRRASRCACTSTTATPGAAARSPPRCESEELGSGYTAKYSAYSEGMSPEQTTQYYFKSGKAVSPTTTITVQ